MPILRACEPGPLSIHCTCLGAFSFQLLGRVRQKPPFHLYSRGPDTGGLSHLVR
jgi:hypothetical protein